MWQPSQKGATTGATKKSRRMDSSRAEHSQNPLLPMRVSSFCSDLALSLCWPSLADCHLTFVNTRCSLLVGLLELDQNHVSVFQRIRCPACSLTNLIPAPSLAAPQAAGVKMYGTAPVHYNIHFVPDFRGLYQFSFFASSVAEGWVFELTLSDYLLKRMELASEITSCPLGVFTFHSIGCFPITAPIGCKTARRAKRFCKGP